MANAAVKEIEPSLNGQEDSSVARIYLGSALLAIASGLAGGIIAGNNAELGNAITFGGWGLSLVGLTGGTALYILNDGESIMPAEKRYFPTEEEIWSAQNQQTAAEIGPDAIVSTTITSLVKAIRTK
jgi:hypothetical protein